MAWRWCFTCLLESKAGPATAPPAPLQVNVTAALQVRVMAVRRIRKMDKKVRIIILLISPVDGRKQSV